MIRTQSMNLEAFVGVLAKLTLRREEEAGMAEVCVNHIGIESGGLVDPESPILQGRHDGSSFFRSIAGTESEGSNFGQPAGDRTGGLRLRKLAYSGIGRPGQISLIRKPFRWTFMRALDYISHRNCPSTGLETCHSVRHKGAQVGPDAWPTLCVDLEFVERVLRHGRGDLRRKPCRCPARDEVRQPTPVSTH